MSPTLRRNQVYLAAHGKWLTEGPNGTQAITSQDRGISQGFNPAEGSPDVANAGRQLRCPPAHARRSAQSVSFDKRLRSEVGWDTSGLWPVRPRHQVSWP